MIQHLWLFVAAELLFSATPGPAAMLVSAFGLKGGMRGALLANLGIQTGNAIYITVSAFGLAALIAASAKAFLAIKLIGAAYLIGLGLWTLWQARKGETENAPAPKGRPWLQALLTQLSNPKAMLFFGAFLPQFLDRGAPLLPQYAVMFAIIMAGETVILGLYGWLGAQGRRLALVARWRDRISGMMLIAIGALFAAARRA